jgi:hypothetical protein
MPSPEDDDSLAVSASQLQILQAVESCPFHLKRRYVLPVYLNKEEED